jgi:hypothetical protein
MPLGLEKRRAAGAVSFIKTLYNNDVIEKRAEKHHVSIAMPRGMANMTK